MHRTTTTATLLLTVAVSALAGCVTVPPPAAPGPPAAPSGVPAPRPDGVVRTPVVQAPAREALEMIGPSRPARPSATPPSRSAPPAPDRPLPPPGHGSASRPERPAPADDGRPPGTAEPPARPGPALGEGTDVCALGQTYGRWDPDSPQAAICREVYGR
ncbi:hypothetical protein [Streptomyces sp. NPDC012589]|uniref:hypothetical protein n=1 Tax=Streptomyces sp. NPDC012589 TaxID=3364839 RepID=UPI0036D1EEA8